MKCRRCPAEADEGFTKCAYHRQLEVDEDRARRLARVASGTCISCPAPASRGQRCAACAAAHIARAKPRNIAPGRCNKCNGPKGRDGRLCFDCIEKATARQSAKRADHAARGLCARCSAPHLPGRTLCLYHAEKQAQAQARAKVRSGHNSQK